MKSKEFESDLQLRFLSTINNKNAQYEKIMNIYEIAMKQVVDSLNEVKKKYYDIFNTNLINSITYRIKTPESIVDKMKKKGYELTFENLFLKINDIAGVRVACPMKENIYTLVDIIDKMPDIRVIKKKDYISKPKKSGYSGYHLIVEKLVVINNEELVIKLEIQLRTMAMDFWSANEHSLKYKSQKKISKLDSKRLKLYAKILNYIDNKMMKIYQKQT